MTTFNGVTTQIINDGAVIRIEKSGKTLLVAKDQVKTIDTVHDNIVRIDIGEGPLKNIFLNYQQIGDPVVASADELRDAIKAMMATAQYTGADAKEATQLNILNQLQILSTDIAAIKQNQADLTQLEPSRVDESNPYLVYRGWHADLGVVGASEWAIERITRIDDEIIHEWAFGKKDMMFRWTDRATLEYMPFDHGHAVQQLVAGPILQTDPTGGTTFFDPGTPPVVQPNLTAAA